MNFEQELSNEHQALIDEVYIDEFGKHMCSQIKKARESFGVPCYILLEYSEKENTEGKFIGQTLIVALAGKSDHIKIMQKAGIFQKIKNFVWRPNKSNTFKKTQ